MIEVLGHHLIEFDSSIKKLDENIKIDPEEINDAFKCEKCGFIIFHYQSDTYDYPGMGNNFYWMYNNGRDYIINILGGENDWHHLVLTCEEEQIKKLLE